MEPIPQPPSTISKILAGLKIASLIAAALAATIVSLAAAGIPIPASVVAVATSIGAIAAALGIASPGLKSGQAAQAKQIASDTAGADLQARVEAIIEAEKPKPPN